uniref:UBX domain-containing protein n=1 Tax=Steinernema glaseri TaxID=37863 RepID=A0A1I8A714_9BILA
MSDYSDYSEVESMSDNDFYECEEEEQYEESSSCKESDLPLFTEGLESIKEIMDNYELIFEQRFGRRMKLFRGSLLAASNAAFKPTGIDKKPLALYIHKDGNEHSHSFPSKVLSNKTISDILKNQFVTWAWDISSPENKARLEEFMAEACMRRSVYAEIQHMRDSEFPKLLVITAPKWVHEVKAVIDGGNSVDEARNVLVDQLKEFVDERSASSATPAFSERDYLLQEQQKEYERCLAEDRAREEKKREKEEEERKKIEEEERLERERLEEERRKEEEAERKKQLLPEEPEASETDAIHLRFRLPGGEQTDRRFRYTEKIEKEEEAERKKKLLPEEPEASETDAIHLRFRLPGGGQTNRRFRYTEKIEFVSTFVESLGFPLDIFDVFNSDRPRKNLAVFQQDSSFERSEERRIAVIITDSTCHHTRILGPLRLSSSPRYTTQDIPSCHRSHWRFDVAKRAPLCDVGLNGAKHNYGRND